MRRNRTMLVDYWNCLNLTSCRIVAGVTAWRTAGSNLCYTTDANSTIAQIVGGAAYLNDEKNDRIRGTVDGRVASFQNPALRSRAICRSSAGRATSFCDSSCNRWSNARNWLSESRSEGRHDDGLGRLVVVLRRVLLMKYFKPRGAEEEEATNNANNEIMIISTKYSSR